MTTVQQPTVKDGITVSDVLSKNVRKHGLTLVTQLATVLKTTRIYDPQHPTVKQAAQDLVAALHPFTGHDGTVILEIKEEYVFLNDIRIRPAAGGFEVFHFLVSAFAARGIGKMSLLATFAASDALAFAAGFHRLKPEDKEPLANLRRWLQEQQVKSLALEAPPEGQPAVVRSRRHSASLEAYYQSVSVLREVQAAIPRKICFRKAKRAMQGLVEMVQTDETEVLALTSVKSPNDYAITHATNTSILAVVMGSRLGLPRKALGELGIAAMFLDLGMMDLDPSITMRPGPLCGSERQAMQRHPVQAARTFLRSERVVDVIIRCMQTSLEHHRGFDRTGYPDVAPHRPNSLFTEIVAICDAYDALTSPRPYRPRPVRPPDAIRILLGQAGTRYDPVLLKVFINAVGVYPVGSVIQLTSGELATVQRPSLDPSLLERPKVRVFADASGRYSERVVDLAQRDHSGAFVHSVKGAVDPEEIGLGPLEHLAVL